MKFVKIQEGYFHQDAIVSLVKTRRPSKGADGVDRQWVCRVTPASVGNPDNPKFCELWLSDEEAGPVIAFMQSEAYGYEPPTKEKEA